ncbi:MAG TPA: hypothetical protein VNC50_07040 [Planctomycetia bacterium]|nr:hypothetical protein [Planctomycetia bacterium]
MIRSILVCGLAAGVALAAFGDDKHEHKLPPRKAINNVGFEKIKTLVGTWVVADSGGNPTDEVMSVIKLTAGGSAVHETAFPGKEMEMISVYTPDGDGVLMTHYCVLGNQPRMKATPKAGDKQLNFEFVGGGNLDPKKDKHMRSAVLTFTDADHIELAGCAWENGEPCKESCGVMKLVRKKN